MANFRISIPQSAFRNFCPSTPRPLESSNPMKELLLLGLHFPALIQGSLVVITQKVEDAMEHQKKNFFFRFSTYGFRLAFCRFCRDDHIP